MSEFISFIVFLSDSIFTGMKFLVPCLFLMNVLNLRIKYFDKLLSSDTAGRLLIAGNILFLLLLGFNIYTSWYRQNEAEKELLLSIITGPHWHQLLVPVFNFALLPVILWFSTMRKSIYPIFNIILFWFISVYLSEYFTDMGVNSRLAKQGIDWNEYFQKTAVCLGIYGIFYGTRFFLLKRPEK